MQFVKEFYPTIGINEEFIPFLNYYSEKLNDIPEFHTYVTELMGNTRDGNEILNDVAKLAETVGCHAYTAHLIFFAFCAEPMLKLYQERHIDEQIFWDSNRDLTWKCRECYECFFVPGTHVANWHIGFYRLNRFALGRLQYEHRAFPKEEYSRAGITLRKGDDVLNCHIPSCGPLTPEKRLDSYKKMYAFYRKDFNTDIIPLMCSSWLLYPEHKDFLPAKSNILGFMSDFDIIEGNTRDNFSNAWRVFGRYAKYPPETWPRDTSIRRAFADRILSGGKTGDGIGVILFDGEKIVR